MSFRANWPRGQRGQAIVLIALMLAVLIGMVALALDGARGYATRRDLQAAIDAASLAAGDSFQRGGSYANAEQSATSVFAENLRLYAAPSCGPYGTPGASPFTVTCTFSDGTVLTETVSNLGPQGASFSLGASRQVRLEFARVLTTGGAPTLVVAGSGTVGNLLYTPAVAALAQSGCGGTGGTALTVNGSGTLSVIGDVVTNGAVSVSSGSMRVGGDIYAHCQSSVAGSVSACYSSGASTPCSYPDVPGATRSGYRLVDPGYPAPALLGGTQGAPNGNVNLPAGIYASAPGFSGGHCWFLGGGVYTWQAGYFNLNDLVSNELKPPDEPDPSNNTVRAASQFWNSNGLNCAGSVQESRATGIDMPDGNWAFEVTSTRTDTYNGTSYFRESAPSSCDTVNVNPHFNDVQITISNLPGPTAYNIYVAPPSSNGCAGPFGLAASLAVSGPVLNTNTNPCPLFTGGGCTLGHESIDMGSILAGGFTPNAAAPPDTSGAYPPDSETAPIAVGLPDQNPARGSGASGDRANENNCESAAGSYTACPAAVTPGAVEFNVPSGGCITTSNSADTYLFSGYQYDWISAYEPPGNSCTNVLGANDNSAYVGLFYAPASTINVSSPKAFEVAATAGLMGSKVSFSGTLPGISYGAGYAPAPPASRLSS